MTDERRIDYTCAGRDLVGLLVLPDGDGPVPGVLVAHEGPGQSDHERGIARRLADLGYAAFALDYHGGGTTIADRAEMFERLGVLMADSGLTRSIAEASLAQLLAEPRVDATRVAAIGYCFGGTMSLELGRSGAELAAIVGFHAGLVTDRPEDASSIRCPVLVCIGADDPIIPAEQRAAFETEMRAGGVDWQMHVYGGVQHTFTNPAATGAGIPGIAYDEDADRRSWKAMLDLFAETIDAPAR
jgi:dienelactone hydrolase